MPHLPIRDVVKVREKTSKLLVDASSNSNRCALNHTLHSDLRVPVVEQTGGFPVQLGYMHPLPFRIRHRVSTKDRASMAVLRSFPHTIIEARQHNVVLVQDMYPATSRQLNASIPSIRQTSVFGFAMERHPPGANSVGNFKCGTVLRTVVDYVDLHLVRAGILLKDALQRFL